MQRLQSRLTPSTLKSSLGRTKSTSSAPLIHIDNATFYRSYPTEQERPTAANPPLFPGLTFSLLSHALEPQFWAIRGPSSSGKTTLLEILNGRHVCIPPAARSYPFLSAPEIQDKNYRLRNPSFAIRYVGFADGAHTHSRTTGSYLSSRYESYREETDFSVLDYLKGNLQLNPSDTRKDTQGTREENLNKIIDSLDLGGLVHMPLGNLSNGQKRRAKIAKGLLDEPEVLLLDEPFMGLDPPTTVSLSTLLYRLARNSSPRLILALRPQDMLPDWITHLVELGHNSSINYQGHRSLALKDATFSKSRQPLLDEQSHHKKGNITERGISNLQDEGVDMLISPNRDCFDLKSDQAKNRVETPEVLVEMKEVRIQYGKKAILGAWSENKHDQLRQGLWWTVRRGERWGVFGPNGDTPSKRLQTHHLLIADLGSGKTTLLSLICSDHPQTYSLPIQVFGRSRLPQPGQPGISIFDIQARIGQSSPEIHAFFPRNLTLRQTLHSAWADTFRSIPRLTPENKQLVDSCLGWFEPELNPAAKLSRQNSLFDTDTASFPSTPHWADTVCFGDAPFSAQRVALFLRAIVKQPDLVILDEAFSGMDESIRDKCMLFLAYGEEARTFKPISADPNIRIKTGIPAADLHPLSGNQSRMKGLTGTQALICVSHLKDEVPDSVREWLCLPDASSGHAARFGRFNGPLRGDEQGWAEVWGG